ncbi:hypothetical protein [Clostridiisalibacter paucivorans]|uniref:hypothetical protein n=1 Tax=Clostridiisalibacter paucivorans TaxID=408753 RepID=UPI00047DCC47|nr:hypothetical protein [Clostridiisalibacter paucivorans]
MNEYIELKRRISEMTTDLTEKLNELKYQKDFSDIETQKKVMKFKSQKEEIDKLILEKESVEGIIYSIPNEKYSMVLDLKYIKDKIWSDVAYEMDCSYQTAFNLQKKALEQYETLKALGCRKKIDVELIKNYLWSAKFSELQDIQPVILNHPITAGYGVMFDHGLIVLNKDNSDYELMKKIFVYHMRTSTVQLLEMKAIRSRRKNKNRYQQLSLDMIDVELIRRGLYQSTGGVLSA